MNNKKLKISIDIDGTINSSDTAISFFQIMTHLLSPDPDIHITILTNREPGTLEQISQELAEMNIQYDKIVITSDKADYIKKHRISVVFENEDEYFQSLGPDILVLKVRERGNYNYMSGRWYGDRNTVELIDE
ncbi:MAG: hypothetical protein JXI43_10575 [Tissierellales bacterium]|nr:hypothetical protein [Tissierellales bacterium]